MLSIYSCTRRRCLARTLMSAATLAVALFAQPAQAQDMAAVRRAVVSTSPVSRVSGWSNPTTKIAPRTFALKSLLS